MVISQKFDLGSIYGGSNGAKFSDFYYMCSVLPYSYSVIFFVFSLILFLFSQHICIQSHFIYIQSTYKYSVWSYVCIQSHLICIQSDNRGGFTDFKRGRGWGGGKGGALYVGHHVWPAKKMLGFRRSKMAEVPLETISFWQNISTSVFKFSPFLSIKSYQIFKIY